MPTNDPVPTTPMSQEQVEQVRSELAQTARGTLARILEAEASGARTITVGGRELRTFSGDPLSSGRGPVLAVLKDLETGQIFYGQNQGRVVENMHPILINRLDSFLTENEYLAGPRVYAYPGRPGSHAEIDAINQALWAQEAMGRTVSEADLGGFALYNIRTENYRSGGIGEPIPRCIVCEPVTRGVIALTDQSGEAPK